MEERDSYVAQLREVFDSCDETGDGYLDETGLQCLCEKLHLSGQANLLISHLLAENSEVNFEEFKECFVAILSQEIPSDDSSKLSGSEDIADREVSPKFVLGRKKYGRRSRPASIVDECDTSVSCESSLEPQQHFAEHSATTGREEGFAGKRPMSPNDCQQPPTKSGRMRESSDSSSSSPPSFESHPVEYLQETWKKLGVGRDGFLNVEELAHVCEHIGMDMTEEVVVQLFQKLDCDQDGRISFEEFLQGLFQHNPHCTESSMKPSYNPSDDHPLLSNTWPSGIFSSIDPTHSGCAEGSSILELWESLELRCPPRLLEELGYSGSSKINLSDLTTTFEEILTSALNRPIMHLAFATFQNELHYLRQVIDQMADERRKLRINVEEANARAALLAQEVDDNHAKLENSLQKKLMLLEKKYQDQLREVSEDLQQERDVVHSQGQQLKQLRDEVTAAQEEEARTKAGLLLLQQENSRLELDLRESAEKCSMAEKLNEALQKELVAVPALKKKLSELESHLLQEQQQQALILELESCKKNNQELQDKIDELTLEMENIQQRSSGSTNENAQKGVAGGVARNHSWLSDYKNTSLVGYKRRGSESSSEENSDEDGIIMNGMKKETASNERPFDNIHMSEALGTTKKFTSAVCGGGGGGVEVLLKDLFLDQSLLTQKLRVAEEKCLRHETQHRRAQLKIRALQQIIVHLNR